MAKVDVGMKQYQYVLFDWDGNLAKTLNIWLKALKTALEKRGHFLEDKEIGANFALFQERFEAQGHQDASEIVAEAGVIAIKLTPSVELYPSAFEVLESLHRSSKKLALVTTSLHAQIDPLLQKHDLHELFQAVVCGDDVAQQKPDPEALHKALKLLGGGPDHAVMIGDSEKDIKAANEAGIDSILFYPSEHSVFYDVEDLKQLKPTYIVQDFREILQIV